MSSFSGKVLAITGGVGGAKLALGLSRLLDPQQLVFAVNTGDDFNHLGLDISPDIDTLVYALSGLSDYQRGWGVVGEGWKCMEMLEKLGGETWFSLGDRDLAMHLQRSALLRSGKNLTEVTNQLAASLAVQHRILPMSNDRVVTQLKLEQDWVDFQDYFVARQCEPVVSGLRYQNAENAVANPEIIELLQSAELQAVIICPSNPFLSIAPILAVSGMREALVACKAPVVVVSPIVAGLAIKGPTAKLMKELDIEQNAKAVADWYGDLLDLFVLDEQDQNLQSAFAGTPLLFAQTIMKTLDEKIELAKVILDHLALCYQGSGEFEEGGLC